MINNDDVIFMDECLALARIAYSKGEVPVGALVVLDGVIIGKGYNKREKKNSVFGHAELVAIKEASKHLRTWKLDDCTLYCNVEPCIMCAGAIMQSRIKRVVYGTSEPKFGALGSILDISSDEYKFNHSLIVDKGVKESESSLLLKTFFKELRDNKNK